MQIENPGPKDYLNEVEVTANTPQVIMYWAADFQTSIPVKSLLYIELQATDYLQFRLGDDPNNNYLNNPQCGESTQNMNFGLLAGGWLDCPQSGRYFSITAYETAATTYFQFMEVMVFSEEFIQHNAISATLSSTLADTTTYFCATSTNCQASNALRTEVVIWPNYPGTTACCIYSQPQLDPTLEVLLKANVMIECVLLTPSDSDLGAGNPNPQITVWQTNVQVWIENKAGIALLCGTLPDYNLYTEVHCQMVGNKIIIKKITSGLPDTLAMASASILSGCDCSQSSFSPDQFTLPVVPFASVTAINARSTDPPVKITFNPNMQDTVSSVCGNADGFSKCGYGRRVITFAQAGKLVTFPYQGFNFDEHYLVLTLDPTAATGTCVLTAILTLVDYPTVFYTQDIISTVTILSPTAKVIPLFVVPPTLNATIGKDAILILPYVNVQYAVIGQQNFQASVDGNQLTVKSLSNSDIGKYSLQMSATINNKIENFTVKVVFTEQETVAPTTNEVNAVSQPTTEATSNDQQNMNNGTVISSQDGDKLLEKVECSTDEKLVITCISTDGRSYTLNAATGNFVQGIPETKDSSPQPKLYISKVNSLGQFFMSFSEPMNLQALIKPINQTRTLKAKGGSSTKGTSGVQKVKSNQGNYDEGEEDSDDPYLLSAKHLRISVLTENTTEPKFTWFVTKITASQIKIQVAFQDPLLISNELGQLDRLVIQILPPALKYMRTLSSRVLAENPLRTVYKPLPQQCILGEVIEAVNKAAVTLKDVGQSVTIGNVVIQILLSGSMAQMWSMVNAQQIILTYQLLNVAMPGNVIMVITEFANICDFNVFPTDTIMQFLFNFTQTSSPGMGFESMGTENKSLTIYLGSAFLIMILIGLQYLLYVLSYCLRNYHKCFKWVEQKLRPGLFFSMIYLFFIETYLDWGIGSSLRMEDPLFQTPSDYFDFGLACAGILITLILPFYCFFFLRKNINRLDQEAFQSKHGIFYEGLLVENLDQRNRSIKMAAWFLLRRFFTAANLIFLRGQTIWIQLTFNMWLSLIDTSFKIELSPYKSKVGGTMEKINDLFVLACSYFQILFTDLTQTQEDKYYIGWYYLGIIGMLIAANLIVIVVTAVQDFSRKIKRMVLLWKHRRQVKELNRIRELTKQAMLKVKAKMSMTVRKPKGASSAGSESSFNGIDAMDDLEMFEQFKAYRELERKKAREAAVLLKVTKELNDIPEVQDSSSIQSSEVSNLDLKIVVKNKRNQVVPFNDSPTSIYVKTPIQESQLVENSLKDVKVKKGSFLQQQMAKYHKILTDNQSNIIEERQTGIQISGLNEVEEFKSQVDSEKRDINMPGQVEAIRNQIRAEYDRNLSRPIPNLEKMIEDLRLRWPEFTR